MSVLDYQLDVLYCYVEWVAEFGKTCLGGHVEKKCGKALAKLVYHAVFAFDATEQLSMTAQND